MPTEILTVSQILNTFGIKVQDKYTFDSNTLAHCLMVVWLKSGQKIINGKAESLKMCNYSSVEECTSAPTFIFRKIGKLLTLPLRVSKLSSWHPKLRCLVKTLQCHKLSLFHGFLMVSSHLEYTAPHWSKLWIFFRAFWFVIFAEQMLIISVLANWKHSEFSYSENQIFWNGMSLSLQTRLSQGENTQLWQIQLP